MKEQTALIFLDEFRRQQRSFRMTPITRSPDHPITRSTLPF